MSTELVILSNHLIQCFIVMCKNDVSRNIAVDGHWSYFQYSGENASFYSQLNISSSDFFGFHDANFNVLDESNNILFQGASQPAETQVVLAEIVENQETNKVMEEIMGILPIVIVVIVSLIAIRKAIAFLRTLLHRS